MRVCHGFTAEFDDPNLVSCSGLAPVLRLAERAGLQDLVAEHVRIDKPGGVNARLKVPALVAGMVAGADSIDDMALLRHGAMGRLFTGVRAPSTLGTFLRTFTFGHVRQLDAVASRLLINLCRQAPLLPGAATLTYLDIDDTVRQTYGYAKHGAGRGYTGVKGLNALLGILSTPGSAPVIAAAQLRRGSTSSAKGAHPFVADTLVTAKAAGATGTLVLRADSALCRYRHNADHAYPVPSAGLDGRGHRPVGGVERIGTTRCTRHDALEWPGFDVRRHRNACTRTGLQALRRGAVRRGELGVMQTQRSCPAKTQRSEPDKQDADYAELLVMPRCGVKGLVAAGLGLVRSA